MTEQKFWNEEAMRIPVIQELVKNWEKIRDEALIFLNSQNPETFEGKTTLSVLDSKLKTYEIIHKEDKDLISGNFVKLFPKAEESGKWDIVYIGENRKRQNNNGDLKQLNDYYENMTVKQTSKNTYDLSTYAISFFTTFNSIIEEYANGQCSACNISIVSPGTEIGFHFGTKGYLRFHLCLINDPKCTITVGDETRSWEEGKILSFKDGGPYAHSVLHNGSKDRVVIIFDMPFDYVSQFIPNIIS